MDPVLAAWMVCITEQTFQPVSTFPAQEQNPKRLGRKPIAPSSWDRAPQNYGTIQGSLPCLLKQTSLRHACPISGEQVLENQEGAQPKVPLFENGNHNPGLPLYRYCSQPPHDTEEVCQQQHPNNVQDLQHLRTDFIHTQHFAAKDLLN